MDYKKNKNIVLAGALTLCVGLAFIARESKSRSQEMGRHMGCGLLPCGSSIVKFEDMDSKAHESNKHKKKKMMSSKKHHGRKCHKCKKSS